jgi:hypothetical protein
MEQDKHMVVGRTSSSKGKRSANSAPKPGAPPKKKRRVLDSDDDDDDDEPLASKTHRSREKQGTHVTKSEIFWCLKGQKSQISDLK